MRDSSIECCTRLTIEFWQDGAHGERDRAHRESVDKPEVAALNAEVTPLI